MAAFHPTSKNMKEKNAFIRGDHAFLLEPTPEGKTRFRQVERFMGPMVLFMGNMIKKTEIG
jgi:hypothetical protein